MSSKLENDAQRLYDTLSSGGLGLTRTNTGYGLVAMKSDAVRRIYALKGRPGEKPCVTVGTLAILDDVAMGFDQATRSWLAFAVARWPMAVVARTNLASKLLRSFEPFVLSQCTKDETIATFFGVGDLIARAAEIAYSRGELVVGSSANLAGTGNNYTLDSVPDVMREAVDLEIDCGPAPFTSSDKRASTILEISTGNFLRAGVCFAEVERSWQSFRTATERKAS
jgi:tRNA A37 threonylcarbamoyladenosine synthetase subunit TsaC/SUA5/YrdC